MGKRAREQLIYSGITNAMGPARNTQGSFNESLELYRKALEIYIKVLGEHTKDVADIYRNIGFFVESKAIIQKHYYSTKNPWLYTKIF